MYLWRLISRATMIENINDKYFSGHIEEYIAYKIIKSENSNSLSSINLLPLN